MSYQDLFNLTTNPFRVIPAKGSNEIYWAGFPEIKDSFEKKIQRAMKISASSLVLNWGNTEAVKPMLQDILVSHRCLLNWQHPQGQKCLILSTCRYPRANHRSRTCTLRSLTK